MKRFVTYLYEYEGGNKTKNTGFIRVDIRNDRVNLEVCIRNTTRSLGIGTLYGFVEAEELLGVELGQVTGESGQSDTRFVLSKDDLNGSGYTIEDIYGIGICFSNQVYYASCWRDEILDKIGEGKFAVFQKETEEIQAAMLEAEEPVHDEPRKEREEQEIHIEEIDIEAVDITYKKIELKEIRNLPSGNWHLCNNSFLVHGFFNYGYLILKKQREEEKASFSLGVPGFFERPEMVMAMVYGFPNFEAVPKEMIELPMGVESDSYKIEKNQRPETGIFGAWYVSLQN